MSEPAEAVRQRAGNRCEYCRLPQSAFRRPFHIEHIVARQHGGSTQLDNLALAVWNCNLKKGPNLSGIDPVTGRVTELFHPRRDEWDEHFSPVIGFLIPLGVAIRGLTPVGRATVQVLGLNDEMRQMLRHELWIEGIYPAATG
jgi:HNH endonuclease